MSEHNKDYNAYKCKICGNQVKNLQTFQNHLNTHRDTRIKHMCEICGLEYTTSRQLQVKIFKAELLQEGIFFLIHIFARYVSFMKKLEIEKTKPTFIISVLKVEY